jgi:hypothetical protein
VLEGAVPVRRITGLGENVWAYLFDRRGTPILALWTPGSERRVSLRADHDGPVEVLDIMGHSARMTVKDGVLELSVNGSPQYIVGLKSM